MWMVKVADIPVTLAGGPANACPHGLERDDEKNSCTM